MKMVCAALAAGAAWTAASAHAHSQEPATAFDPRVVFAPVTFPDPSSRFRSADGTPSPDYWQNRADYDIDARLDPTDHTLAGREVITYTNNSPSELTSLWLQLDQNVYRRDARAAPTLDHWRAINDVTRGYVIDRVEVEAGGAWRDADRVVSDTRLQVKLANPLQRHGGRLRLRITYRYTIPGAFGGRTAWINSKNGPIYDIAQWYPRMCVFDDVRGWNTLPYLTQEFYLEYGDIDYAVTVPGDMIVIGGGELTNPQDVLSPGQQAALAAARRSDATIVIRSGAEAAAPTLTPPRMKTWRFHMIDTRDVAFGASKAFIWDAARINLPGGKTALAQSVYPVESAGPRAWGRSTEYLKDTVEHLSRRWFAYPYPTASNVAGGVSGMEYPGMAFDGVDDKGVGLFWLTAHEIGHSWFPMIVGFDERRDAWMDEGFNTFIDTFESDEFAGGIFGPKHDPEYAPDTGKPADDILKVLRDPNAPPILTRADLVSETYRHPVTYFKSAYGLTLLRNVILGPDRFDPAFRKFISAWAYKHPKPSDFFRLMNSEGGEDLSWWWRGWYFNNWQLDYAVDGVTYVDGDPHEGAKIQVETRGQLVLPAEVRVRYSDGQERWLALPVEAWMLGAHADLSLDGGPPIAEVVIDPDHLLPDQNRDNTVLNLTASPRPK